MFLMPTPAPLIQPGTFLEGIGALKTGLENRIDALFFGFFLAVFVLIFVRAAILKLISDEMSQVKGDF